MKASLLVLILCGFMHGVRGGGYNCMRYDFERGLYLDLRSITVSSPTDLRVTDLVYVKDETAQKGNAYVSVCGRREVFGRCAGRSHGFFVLESNNECLPLTDDSDESTQTIWDMGLDAEKGVLIIEANNKNTGFGFDYVIEVSCDPNEDKKLTGEFDRDLKKFKFHVASKFACEQRIPNLTMVFHQYRLFVMGICLSIGLFLNFVGVRKLRVSLMTIGFFFFFGSSFIVISSIFYLNSTGLIVLFNLLVSSCLGAVGAYFALQLERFVNYFFVVAVCCSLIFLFSYVVINFILLLCILAVIGGATLFLAKKKPRAQLAISTSFIGSNLVFLSLCLTFFGPEDISYYLFHLREGKLGKLNLLFILLFFMSLALFIYGVYSQLMQQKEIIATSADYFSRNSDIYRSLNDGRDVPQTSDV